MYVPHYGHYKTTSIIIILLFFLTALLIQIFFILLVPLGDLDESVFVGNNSISQQQSSSQRQLVSSLPQLNMGTNYAMVKHVLTPIINLFILNGFV